jgi:GNAT superfamily N-acetyltransferase
MILFRPMVHGDIPAGLSLCRTAGWNQTPKDWELFLELSPNGCRVAVDEGGQVRGTVATVRYGDRFSWIGMVLVDPAMQRQGIGIQLLRESIHMLSEESTVKLDATPAGRKIYLQLDFVDEYPLSRIEIKTFSPEGLPASSARVVQQTDLPALLETDRRVFGADRRPVINSILKRAPQFAFLLEGPDGLKGYCFGRAGHAFTHIGPVIATDVAAAKEVVSAALQNSSGTPVVLDILHHTTEWVRWLTSLGFQEQRPLIRMFRGTNDHPGTPEEQFAILGPEFG